MSDSKSAGHKQLTNLRWYSTRLCELAAAHGTSPAEFTTNAYLLAATGYFGKDKAIIVCDKQGGLGLCDDETTDCWWPVIAPMTRAGRYLGVPVTIKDASVTDDGVFTGQVFVRFPGKPAAVKKAVEKKLPGDDHTDFWDLTDFTNTVTDPAPELSTQTPTGDLPTDESSAGDSTPKAAQPAAETKAPKTESDKPEKEDEADTGAGTDAVTDSGPAEDSAANGDVTGEQTPSAVETAPATSAPVDHPDEKSQPVVDGADGMKEEQNPADTDGEDTSCGDSKPVAGDTPAGTGDGGKPEDKGTTSSTRPSPEAEASISGQVSGDTEPQDAAGDVLSGEGGDDFGDDDPDTPIAAEIARRARQTSHTGVAGEPDDNDEGVLPDSEPVTAGKNGQLTITPDGVRLLNLPAPESKRRATPFQRGYTRGILGSYYRATPFPRLDYLTEDQCRSLLTDAGLDPAPLKQSGRGSKLMWWATMFLIFAAVMVLFIKFYVGLAAFVVWALVISYHFITRLKLKKEGKLDRSGNTPLVLPPDPEAQAG